MNKKGFSLIELLLAMGMALVVGMVAYTIFSSSNKTLRVQQDIVEEQQNLRMALEMMAKDIRQAGFGLPNPPFALTIGGSTFNAPISIGNSPSTASDSITVLGIGYELGRLTNQGGVACGNGIGCNNAGANCLCISNVQELFSDATGTTPTINNSRRYVTLGGEVYQELQAGQSRAGNTVTLASPATLIRGIPNTNNTTVYIIQAVQYAVDTGTFCTTANPCLTIRDFTGLRSNGTQVFADNVEDTQLAYGLDGSLSPDYRRDGRIDDKNANGNYDALDFRFSEAGDPNITDLTNIIAARLSLTAKARNADIDVGPVFLRPAIEDRGAGTNDRFRRRSLTSVVKLRNPKVGGH